MDFRTEIPSNAIHLEEQRKAYLKKDKNPNSYFYRYNDLNEQNRTGFWTQREKESFLQRLRDHGAQNWGIFSRAIEGREGFQCANYYRYLLSRGEIDEMNVKKKKKLPQKKPRLRWYGRKDKQNERTFHDECTIDGESFKVNDVILLRCSIDTPRIAKIEAMYSKKPGRKLFKCRWLYRFEDLLIEDEDIKKIEFNDREVFLSNVYSVRSLQDVIKKCRVLPKSDFNKLEAKDVERMEANANGEGYSVFYCEKYFNGQINFEDDSTEEDEKIEMLKPQEIRTESLFNYPISFDAKVEASLYSKSEQDLSTQSTKKSPTAPISKKNPPKDTIYCCIEGCKNICWTKRLASNLKNHWDLKEGGKYICGTHYNKDKKQKMNSTNQNNSNSSNNVGNTTNNTNNNNNTTPKIPPKKRKLPEKDDVVPPSQSLATSSTSSSTHSYHSGPSNNILNNLTNLSNISANISHSNSNSNNHSAYNNGHHNNNMNNYSGYIQPSNTVYSHQNSSVVSKSHSSSSSSSSSKKISPIPSPMPTKKIKKNPVTSVRGVVVYKDKIQKENAIGEIIIFPTTTIEQMKELICKELEQELPFDIKRCHIPILPSQYQKLAFLYFNDRVEDSLVIVPPIKTELIPNANRENLLGLLQSAIDYQIN